MHRVHIDMEIDTLITVHNWVEAVWVCLGFKSSYYMYNQFHYLPKAFEGCDDWTSEAHFTNMD